MAGGGRIKSSDVNSGDTRTQSPSANARGFAGAEAIATTTAAITAQ